MILKARWTERWCWCSFPSSCSTNISLYYHAFPNWQAERERTNDLIRELEELKLERDNLKAKEKELDNMKTTCQDQETALAELGIQVSGCWWDTTIVKSLIFLQMWSSTVFIHFLHSWASLVWKWRTFVKRNWCWRMQLGRPTKRLPLASAAKSPLGKVGMMVCGKYQFILAFRKGCWKSYSYIIVLVILPLLQRVPSQASLSELRWHLLQRVFGQYDEASLFRQTSPGLWWLSDSSFGSMLQRSKRQWLRLSR